MINKKLLRIMFTGLLLFGMSFSSNGQATKTEPWTESQLMPPIESAKIIKDSNALHPVVFSIGPGAIVKGSIDIGPAKERVGLEILKQQLSKLPKETAIVIYCGCCPFQQCPNILPAFELLNELKFTNHMLLNLPKNIKVDWINKGFPVND